VNTAFRQTAAGEGIGKHRAARKEKVAGVSFAQFGGMAPAGSGQAAGRLPFFAAFLLVLTLKVALYAHAPQ
jgi:hypothetical protein